MSTLTFLKKLSITTVRATLVVLGIQGVAHATVLTFDDIAPISTLASIPNGYGGFNWYNFFYTNSSGDLHTGYYNGRVSGNYVAFNGSGSIAYLTDGVFDFNSAYLTAAWNDGLSVTVEGLNNGSVLYTKTVVVDTTGPTFVNFDFLGVNQLMFMSSGGVDRLYPMNNSRTQFALDNFTYAASVPEPSAIRGLAAFGLGCLLIKKKLSSKNKAA